MMPIVQAQNGTEYDLGNDILVGRPSRWIIALGIRLTKHGLMSRADFIVVKSLNQSVRWSIIYRRHAPLRALYTKGLVLLLEIMQRTNVLDAKAKNMASHG